MEPNNNAAFIAFTRAGVSLREAIAVAAGSPIPGDTWHNIGRSMELVQRVISEIKPKGAPTPPTLPEKPTAKPNDKA